jgi:O-antigen ligase
VAVVLVWVTFPGGGVYPWVWVPAAGAILLLAIAIRPKIGPGEAAWLTDGLLVAAGAALAIQLVPLARFVLDTIDPHAREVRAALWLVAPETLAEGRALPISLVPGDTVAALGVFVASVLLFWVCRRICEEGGTGRLVRMTAFIGLVASVGAIVHHAQDSRLLWGIWLPLDEGARPYGPFVNRNHFATWLIMASALVFGYLLARAPQRSPSPLLSQRVATALKQLGTMRIWLVASVSVMTLALLTSTSRSGLIGLMCALLMSSTLTKERTGPSVRRWTVLQAVVLIVVAVSFANFDSLMDRYDQTLKDVGPGRGRRAVWHDALRVIRRFPITGTGAGTFGTAVTVYQTSESGYSIGQAHNHYLQLAAEGGALVAVPAVMAIGAFVALCRRRLAEDDGPDHLVRVGAISGIAGVLLQSLWETGLRMPANALLLAVLAAVATHAPAVEPKAAGRAS